MVDGGEEMNVDVDQDAYGLVGWWWLPNAVSLNFPTVAEWHSGSGHATVPAVQAVDWLRTD